MNWKDRRPVIEVGMVENIKRLSPEEGAGNCPVEQSVPHSVKFGRVVDVAEIELPADVVIGVARSLNFARGRAPKQRNR